MIADVDDDRKY